MQAESVDLRHYPAGDHTPGTTASTMCVELIAHVLEIFYFEMVPYKVNFTNISPCIATTKTIEDTPGDIYSMKTRSAV